MKLKEKIIQFYKKHTKAFNIIENILIVLLVLVAYALGFSNGVKECTNNQNNSQIEEKQANRRNSNSQLYGMVADDEYYTTIHETNLFNFEDPEIENFEVDFAYGTLDELYIDEILTEPTIDSYIAIGFCYDPTDFQTNNTEDVSVSFNLSNYNNDSINNLDDNKYYYVYSALEIVPMNNNYSSPEYYMVNHRFISSDHQALYYENSYINPIFKGSSLKATLEYLYISFDLFFTNRFDYTSFYIRLNLSVFDLSDFTDVIYNDGYNTGFNGGYTGGYTEGYDEGINFKTYGGLNYLDYIQFWIDEEGREFDKEYLIENNYLSNGGLYLSKLGEELGFSYSSSRIYLNFNDLPSNYLNLLFNVFGNGSDYINVIVSSNYGEVQYSFDSYANDKLILTPDLFGNSFYIDAIYIDYDNLEYVGSIINLNNGYNDGYNKGYNEGYNNGLNNGVSIGVDKVINDPNNYDLYNQSQVDEIENNSYSDGYTSGLDYVISNPNEFLLYTSSQLQEAVQQALQEADKTLSNVWTIIRNAASAVSEVMSIQIMPGISLATLVGIFVGIPLLLWAIKILAS